MYFLDNNSGIATMPPLKETQSTTPLWFTEGDGHKGISWPGEDWFNIQQAEQLALLDAAGIRPDKGKLNQLTLAIRAIIGQEALLKTQALAEIAAAGKGAQEKARTHLGLGKLATQDGIQEATLHRKGIVQLNSSPRSADETTAVTPKAVNDRVNAVIDKAPSDLDTLNKLAQAISNNPKFAESVTQLLSQKLAKNENGADIPDKNQFLENLGLLEPRFSTFFNGGVFAVPEGITTVYVSGCGAGGGGGGGLGYLNGYTSGGGGGGAGKAVIREAVKVTPGEQITITIGRGGKGGAGGASNNSGIKGENGGLTALGDLLMLPGGDGGPPGIGGTNGYGGAGYPYGETAIGGNLNGMSTFYMVAASGASCAFGGGGPGGHVGSQGAHHARPAYGYGAGGGGGGGTRISGTAGGNGGDGANGWLTIEW